MQRLETKYTALLKVSQATFEQNKNSTEGGEAYSVRKDIVDVNGKEYETVVELDKIASKRVLSEPKRLLNYIKTNFVGLKIPVEDSSGNIEIIEFAAENDTTTKKGSTHPVLRELAHTKGETRRKVIINAIEVIEESIYDPEYSSKDNEHGWLDKNGWESRKTYVLQDGIIYEAYLKIAKAIDGRNILYAVNLNINNGIAVDQGATNKRAAVLATMPSSYSISNTSANVNTESNNEQYSVSSDENQETDYTAKFDEVAQQFQRGDITRDEFVTVNVGKGKTDNKYHIYDLTEPKERNTPNRINGFGRPVGIALGKGVSNTNIPTPTENVKDNPKNELYSVGLTDAEELDTNTIVLIKMVLLIEPYTFKILMVRIIKYHYLLEKIMVFLQFIM